MTRLFVCVLSCLFCQHAQAQTIEFKRDLDRPNILLIMADDLGYETVDCYGGRSYGTPRINQLARQGIRFTNAYAMPLCTNTRTQLMTGVYNSRTWTSFGILPPSATTFGHLMQAAGYRTCMAGKWRLTSYDPPDYPGAELRRNTGMKVSHAGFDEYSLWHVGHTENKGSRYADPVIEQNGEMLTDTRGKYGPDIWTDFLCEFFEQDSSQPFFAYYSMALPHNPMNPTPDSPEWADAIRRNSDETPFAADMIRYTDKMVGKLVDKLESLGIRDRTLVIFYSDNGTNARVVSELQSGQKLRGEKGLPTQLGLRVPAIVSWPGVLPEGQESDSLLESTDFLPTILEAANASEKIPTDADGVAQFASWRSGQAGPREWVYIHQDPRPGWDKDRFMLDRLAIDKRYKLHEDGRMFDLKADPFETRPLFFGDNPQATPARLKLQKVLDDRRSYDRFDPVEVPRPNPADYFRDYVFQDQGGLIVIEAEQLPLPRDESWRVEAHAPDYTGLGYLRCLRDETQASPTDSDRGVIRIPIHAKTAGQWQVSIRCRTDHPERRDSAFLIKAAKGGIWSEVNCGVGNGKPGQWQWIDLAADPSSAAPTSLPFAERSNQIWLAPKSQNVKIDRIVLYQADRAVDAKQEDAPVSDFHPWAKP